MRVASMAYVGLLLKIALPVAKEQTESERTKP